MADGNGKIAARFETGGAPFLYRSDNSGVGISYARRIFTRSCGKRTPKVQKRTPKGCVVPLVACKGFMRREAPNLGAGVGQLGSYRAVGQARKRAGFGAGFGAGMRPALLQVARRGCSRSGGLRVSAGAGLMQGR